jgi:hypothetical protein
MMSLPQLFARDHAIVIGVQPIEHIRVAAPFILAELTVVVDVHLAQPRASFFSHLLPSLNGFVPADDSVVVSVEPVESARISLPLVLRNLSVMIDVRALEPLRRVTAEAALFGRARL